jgi:hypothetical protein
MAEDVTVGICNTPQGKLTDGYSVWFKCESAQKNVNKSQRTVSVPVN